LTDKPADRVADRGELDQVVPEQQIKVLLEARAIMSEVTIMKVLVAVAVPGVQEVMDSGKPCQAVVARD
jgi:hypothetical protein